MMEIAAFDVFINGILGVFAGITVLYGAIRLSSVVTNIESNKKD
jgi:hypothetical protein